MSVRMYAQAPSRGDPDGAAAFRGEPHGTFLAALAGVDERTFHELVDARNLLERFPGREDSGKGDLFPKKEASAAALRALETWENGDLIVMVGRGVASAFEWRGPPDWFSWWWLSRSTDDTEVDVQVALFPHPSRVNRYWNEPDNVHSAAEFLRDLVELARRG